MEFLRPTGAPDLAVAVGAAGDPVFRVVLITFGIARDQGLLFGLGQFRRKGGAHQLLSETAGNDLPCDSCTVTPLTGSPALVSSSQYAAGRRPAATLYCYQSGIAQDGFCAVHLPITRRDRRL